MDIITLVVFVVATPPIAAVIWGVIQGVFAPPDVENTFPPIEPDMMTESEVAMQFVERV
jgi:hypothetical protein